MRRYLPVLKRIQRMSDKAKRKVIKDCDRQLIECFCECSKNILKGNVPLNGRQMRQLRRRKNNLRALALKKTSLKAKRKILQTGGFIGALLAPAIGIIANLVGGLVSGNNGAR